jgi:hypothetical protein
MKIILPRSILSIFPFTSVFTSIKSSDPAGAGGGVTGCGGVPKNSTAGGAWDDAAQPVDPCEEGVAGLPGVVQLFIGGEEIDQFFVPVDLSGGGGGVEIFYQAPDLSEEEEVAGGLGGAWLRGRCCAANGCAAAVRLASVRIVPKKSLLFIRSDLFEYESSGEGGREEKGYTNGGIVGIKFGKIVAGKNGCLPLIF